MINLIFAALVVVAIVWAARTFYFPTQIAQHPEKYPLQPDTKVSKKDLAVMLSNLQRWRKEGKISREEYDHLTDVCLSEMQQISDARPPNTL